MTMTITISRIAFGRRVNRTSHNGATFHTFPILTIALCLLVCISANALSLRPPDVSKRRIPSFLSIWNSERQGLRGREQAVLDSRTTFQYTPEEEKLLLEHNSRQRPCAPSASPLPNTEGEKHNQSSSPLT